MQLHYFTFPLTLHKGINVSVFSPPTLVIFWVGFFFLIVAVIMGVRWCDVYILTQDHKFMHLNMI